MLAIDRVSSRNLRVGILACLFVFLCGAAVPPEARAQAAADTPAQSAAGPATYDVILRGWHYLRRKWPAAGRRRCRFARRSHRGGRKSRRGEGAAGDQRPRPGRCAWLYQYALLGNDFAAGRWPLAKRYPAGSDARSVWRRVVDGPAQRSHEERHDRWPGRHQVRRSLDHAR